MEREKSRLKPKDLALAQRLLGLDKPHFGVADLEKVLGQRRPSLYVTLTRLVDYGMLVRSIPPISLSNRPCRATAS